MVSIFESAYAPETASPAVSPLSAISVPNRIRPFVHSRRSRQSLGFPFTLTARQNCSSLCSSWSFLRILRRITKSMYPPRRYPFPASRRILPSGLSPEVFTNPATVNPTAAAQNTTEIRTTIMNSQIPPFLLHGDIRYLFGITAQKQIQNIDNQHNKPAGYSRI